MEIIIGITIIGTLSLWGKCKRRKRKIPGIKNLGNTCFFNSVLQSLSSVDKFIVYLSLGEGELTRELLLVLLELRNKRIEVLEPRTLIDLLNKYKPMLDFRQQDAQELYQLLSTQLSIENPEFKVTLSLLKTKVENLKNPLLGLLVSRLSCVECLHSSFQHSTFDCLSLPLNQNCTLKECFLDYTKLEHLEAQCSKCKKQQQTKQLLLARCPEVMVIHINRVILKNGFVQKNHYNLDFCFNFDLGEFQTGGTLNQTPLTTMSSSNSKMNYELRAIVCHSGRHDSGHFFTYRNYLNNWILCSDEETINTNEQNVLNQGESVFLMFFELI